MTGADLRRWRLKRNYTQAQAAKVAGVSQEMWSMMESGTKAVPDSIRSRITLAYSGPSSSAPRGPYKD